MAISRIRDFFFRHERVISAASIVAAFIFDSVTLVRVDFYLTQLVLVVYLLVVALGILAIQLRASGKNIWIGESGYTWLLIAMQFSLGGLFGRYLIYYGRSGSLEVSWPFLLLLLSLLVGNEFARKYYTRFVLLVSFLYLTLLCFLIFVVPIAFGAMNAWLFILSGLISLACIYAYARFLERLIPEKMRIAKTRLFFAVTGIFAFMNILYFANIIPPLPLALHDGGIYHYIEKTGGTYEALKEKDDRWFGFLRRNELVHISAGQPLYAYSAVFAPARFGASVVHEWQKYDMAARVWRTHGVVSFPIVGGQDRGYRGYTIKSNITPGLWRVNIETARGQTIGRLQFEAVAGKSEKPFAKETL